MLRAIRRFFEDNIQTVAGKAADSEQALRLATAALLIEMTRADHEVDERERRAVAESVQRIFNLDAQQTQTLLQLAEQEAKQATSLFQFTRLVDKHFSVEQKKRVLEMLWRVAYADAHKDKHEEHLVRKIADLLHLGEVDFAYTRHKVEEEMKK